MTDYHYESINSNIKKAEHLLGNFVKHFDKCYDENQPMIGKKQQATIAIKDCDRKILQIEEEIAKLQNRLNHAKQTKNTFETALSEAEGKVEQFNTLKAETLSILRKRKRPDSEISVEILETMEKCMFCDNEVSRGYLCGCHSKSYLRVEVDENRRLLACERIPAEYNIDLYSGIERNLAFQEELPLFAVFKPNTNQKKIVYAPKTTQSFAMYATASDKPNATITMEDDVLVLKATRFVEKGDYITIPINLTPHASA